MKIILWSAMFIALTVTGVGIWLAWPEDPILNSTSNPTATEFHAIPPYALTQQAVIIEQAVRMTLTESAPTATPTPTITPDLLATANAAAKAAKNAVEYAVKAAVTATAAANATALTCQTPDP